MVIGLQSRRGSEQRDWYYLSVEYVLFFAIKATIFLTKILYSFTGFKIL
jgi:hypothetical protein